jgi:hypothetical protein
MILVLATMLSTGFVTLVTIVTGYRHINSLWTFGPVYWILRDSGKKKDSILSIGFMRQTSSPWRTGKGLQVRCNKYIFQLGLCKKANQTVSDDDHSGLLYALKGHQLTTPVKEIREWK